MQDSLCDSAGGHSATAFGFDLPVHTGRRIYSVENRPNSDLYEHLYSPVNHIAHLLLTHHSEDCASRVLQVARRSVSFLLSSTLLPSQLQSRPPRRAGLQHRPFGPRDISALIAYLQYNKTHNMLICYFSK